MGCDGCELWNEATGVKRCYAGTLTERYRGHSKGYPEKFTEPQLFPERIAKMLRWSDLTGTERKDKPWLNGYPRLIFLGDMGDNFTESLPLDWLAPYVADMINSPHSYIVLTKRPGRMVEFWRNWLGERDGISIPSNFWLLTSVTGPENGGRIRELLKLRALGASVLGVSYEPAWGAVDFRPFLLTDIDFLDWIIAGGESGTGAKPSHPDFIRAARDACQTAGAAFFFKQWGEYAPMSRTDGFHELPFGDYSVSSGWGFLKQGKKASGALLDGRDWRQMPQGSLICAASSTTGTSLTESV